MAIDKDKNNNDYFKIEAEEKDEAIKDVDLENTTTNKSYKKKAVNELIDYQIDFTMIEKDNLINSIADIDIMALTPMDAMNKLYKLTLEAKRLK